jgi:hypothetical protein
MKSKERRKTKATGRTVRSSQRPPKRRTAPRTAAQYNAKPEKFKDMWDRVVTVVSKMRSEKISLERASRELGISPKTVKRWAGSSLRKRTNGSWAVKRVDRLLRVLKVPARDGTRDIAVRGSGQATLLAEYWNAVHRYLETGDASRLKKFRGKFITNADGVKVPLLTAPAELNRLGSAGVLSFESLYARSI